MTAKEVILRLQGLSDSGHRERMSRFGIRNSRALGVSVPKIRALARQIGKDQKLAAALWNSQIHEARILAPMVSDPVLVTEEILEKWVVQIDSWDICDGFCGGLVDKTPFAIDKAFAWCEREEEFVRRAGFVIMASLAVHDKQAPNSTFEQFFPLILKYSDDNRNFVKKAINWALRQIGKRNSNLNLRAIQIAKQLKARPDTSSRWIGSDALRELQSEQVKKSLANKRIVKRAHD